MIQALKNIGTDLATIGLIGADLLGVVLGVLILGISIHKKSIYP